MISLLVNRQRVHHWTLKHLEGSIMYNPSTGHIQVKKSGYYFVYSQMYYCDGSSAYMAHATYINNNKVMGSIGSVINSKKFLDSKYHGGVFLLRENDTISVHVSYLGIYCMTSGESFFGAYRIGGPGTPGKQMNIILRFFNTSLNKSGSTEWQLKIRPHSSQDSSMQLNEPLLIIFGSECKTHVWLLL